MSRASGRAEATINRILAGITAPSAAVLQDLAPALQLPIADLPARMTRPPKIGTLVPVASRLSPEQVERVTALARQLKATDI